MDSISETVYMDLIRELTHFEFIQKESKNEKNQGDRNFYTSH